MKSQGGARTSVSGLGPRWGTMCGKGNRESEGTARRPRLSAMTSTPAVLQVPFYLCFTVMLCSRQEELFPCLPTGKARRWERCLSKAPWPVFCVELSGNQVFWAPLGRRSVGWLKGGTFHVGRTGNLDRDEPMNEGGKEQVGEGPTRPLPRFCCRLGMSLISAVFTLGPPLHSSSLLLPLSLLPQAGTEQMRQEAVSAVRRAAALSGRQTSQQA